MFQHLEAAPPDAILGLADTFRRDPNPQKINLTVGVYCDASGKTPVLASVKEAERRLLETESVKTYLAIDGIAEYGLQVRELLFGPEHEALASGRAVTVQTPGGTGGLRVVGDFIHRLFPQARVWCSTPTWPNHPAVFRAAGMEVAWYPYYDPATGGVDVGRMLDALRTAAAGDVVCLHPCCHNPTGADPAAGDWDGIADVIFDRGLMPLLDFAYQGFGDGLREDARAVEAFCRPGAEVLIVSSFSKNFGLYRERVGALTAVAADRRTAETVLSQLKNTVRTNYSNPPSHGGAVVSTILSDADLRRQWERELAAMRDRINGMRALFADTMQRHAPGRDFGFIRRGRGMFSLSGLSPEQVDALRERHSLYIVRDGRVNVAGMTADSMERLCGTIASVLCPHSL
ncbi:MAG TPA: amino acid aminotransferase [Planctomycetaceae bacterium]|nr:amino acid aminotransferase [Planctomycetaceae bacterium]